MFYGPLHSHPSAHSGGVIIPATQVILGMEKYAVIDVKEAQR